MAKRVAILGGSFDPPHYGHIHLALAFQDLYKFDKVWIVPNYANPLKEAVASASDRLFMTRLAFERVPYCKVLDVEVSRKKPSFTVDTLEFLLHTDIEFQSAERFLLIASDVARSFGSWKNIDRVLEIAQPIVAASNPYQEIEGISQKSAKLVESGWTVFEGINLSSTLVRSRLFSKKYVGHLIPREVEEYIIKHNLYNKE